MKDGEEGEERREGRGGKGRGVDAYDVIFI